MELLFILFFFPFILPIIIVSVIVALILKFTKKPTPAPQISLLETEYRRGYEDGWKAALAKTNNMTATTPLANVIEPTSAEGDNAVHTAPRLDPSHTLTATSTAQSTPAVTVESKNPLINLTAYVGSLFLVGATWMMGLTLLGSGGSMMIAFMSVALYYILGHYLNARVALLKPVSLAFIVTALATLPITALFVNANINNPQLSWLIVSVISMVLYFHTMSVFKRPFLSYMILVSFMSVALSMTSVFAVGAVWYVMSMLAVGIVANCVRLVLRDRIPSYAAQAFVVANHFVPVLTVCFAYFIAWQLSALDLACIHAVTALHYIVVLYSSPKSSPERTTLWGLVRYTVQATVIFSSYALTKDAVVTAHVFALSCAVQGALSIVRLMQDRVRTYENGWLAASISAVFICGLFQAYSLAHYDHGMLSLIYSIALSIAAVVVTKRAYWLMACAAALALLGPWLFDHTLKLSDKAMYITLWYAIAPLIGAATLYIYAAMGHGTRAKSVAVRNELSILALGVLCVYTVLAFVYMPHIEPMPFITLIIASLSLVVYTYVLHSTAGVLLSVFYLGGLIMTGCNLAKSPTDFALGLATFAMPLLYFGGATIARSMKWSEATQKAFWATGLGAGIALTIFTIFASLTPSTAWFNIGAALVFCVAGALESHQRREYSAAVIVWFLAVFIVIKNIMMTVVGEAPILVVHALAGACLGAGWYLRAVTKNESAWNNYITSALVIFSVGTLFTLNTTEWTPYTTMAEYIGILILGLMTGNRKYGYWGTAGISVLLLMMTARFGSGTLFVAGILILGMVGYAVYRETQKNKNV